MIKNKRRYNSVKSTIESERDSGFKNTAYAVAELIDNSIQAGFRKKLKHNNVNLIIVTENLPIDGRNLERITQIIIADEAEGMDEDTLGIALSKGESLNKSETGHGKMGRYGFGLYMSSISQCKRTEIYSWQNNNFLKSWLDIDEILESKDESSEYVPVEKVEDLPDHLKKIIGKQLKDYSKI